MNKFTDEQVQRAAANGISHQVLHNRVSRGWDLELAITKPPESDKSNTRHRKEKEGQRSESWYSFGNNALLKCPVPDCDHVGGVITKVHCRMHHNLERDEVKEMYGMPITINVLLRSEERGDEHGGIEALD